ncbi:MAG: hypothetical protein ABSF23_08635 [Terracidiphilus sp.]
MDEVKALVEQHAHGECVIVPEKDFEHRVTVLRVNLLPKADPKISAIAGEALFAIRSALDHIVWQLVLTNTSHNPTSSNQFPITTSAKDFAEAIRRRQLRGVSPEAMKLIDGLQPYQTEGSPLRLLNHLHNIDKHRMLNVVTVVADNSEIIARYGDEPYFGLFLGNEELRDGAAFGNIGVPFDLPPEFASINGRLPKMQMHGKCSLFVAFDDPAAEDLEELRVELTLEKILEFVRDTVVPAFEPFFE